MLFNSFEFVLFLPAVFLGYWFVFNRSLRMQNIFIVAASYLFYGWWDWRFLILIAFTSLCSYSAGLLIEMRPRFARWTNAANIILNLGILCTFKYYDFFVSSFAGLLGCRADGLLLHVILPVGISFYTFQALSYSIDVYRGAQRATRDLIAFFAYISFFPQLVAGPIERATNLLPQFLRPRRFDPAAATDGLRQMLWGVFKKMVVADNCAILANYVFAEYASESGGMLILGALAFTFQIYGDFSGYSDIAIGVARLFGFSLIRNFNCPYFSRDIAEFWRRWHISLNTWFRDYVYIPLGGSRGGGKLTVIRNTFAIFLLSGLWHGANWTFLLWGTYNAVLFLPLILRHKNRRYTGAIAEGRTFPKAGEALRILTTFLLAAVGWIIFRAEDIGQAGRFIARICSRALFEPVVWPDSWFESSLINALIGIVLVMGAEWFQRDKQHALQFSGRGILRFASARAAVYYLLAAAVYLMFAQQQTFIYFQF